MVVVVTVMFTKLEARQVPVPLILYLPACAAVVAEVVNAPAESAVIPRNAAAAIVFFMVLRCCLYTARF